MKTFLSVVFLFVTGLGSAWSQVAKPMTLADLAKYTAPDRERILYEGAKKEGKLVWYTSLVPYKEIAKFFEGKYPGVQVEAYRARSKDVALRILTETRSRRYFADAIETTTPDGLMVLRDNQALMPYISPHLARYPEGSKEKTSGGLVFWAIDRESYIGVGYNKNIISAAEVPKDFGGLLEPALKGKMATSDDEPSARLIGAMVKAKGEDFVRKLREQNIILQAATATSLTDLIASGEVPLSFTAFNTDFAFSASKGAPLAWVPMELVAANAGGIAVSAHAQHPHAALLLLDYLLSPEGQKILTEKFTYGSPVKDYGFKRWYPEQGLTTSEYAERLDRWQKLLLEITRR